MLKLAAQSWWEADRYDRDHLVPPELVEDIGLWGPQGPALVRVYENGTTQQGWGLNPPKGSSQGFADRYGAGQFLTRRTEYGYDAGNHAAALVMRSTRMMCVDIDGKNGGLDHVSKMGVLPATLAEQSKSGNGYHLFYSVPDEWTSERGFDAIPDQIGIVQGVDIRGVGCVYHYPQQRWNSRALAEIPRWLFERLVSRKKDREARVVELGKINTTLDPIERLMMHKELLDELAKPIKAGARNNTLFAIGGKLKQAGVDDWEKAVHARAIEIGLDVLEAEKIIGNIENYG